MTESELVEYFKSHPTCLKQGKGYLAKRLHTSKAAVEEARLRVKALRTTAHIPKVLLFDVETAPMRAYVWGRWKQNIPLQATISEWYMLCWSAKWLYSKEVISDKLTSEEAITENDKRIVTHLWELINEADIVIAYNGTKADIPWMNTRFIINGLLPPKPYFIVDPCEVARKSFGFSSNKLDALAGYFGIPHKLDTDFSLWDRAVRGNDEALSYMSIYCSQDVVILEEVYLKLRPWIKNHPNMSNLASIEIASCSNCGNTNLEILEGQYYYTTVGKYQLYRCKVCGTISRGRVNLNTKETRPQTVALGR